MARKYEDYAKVRRSQLSPQEQSDLRAFSSVYEFGQILAEARRARAVTQQELSDLSGVTQADISRIERGLLAPTSNTIMRLVNALDGELRIELRGHVSAS